MMIKFEGLTHRLIHDLGHNLPHCAFSCWQLLSSPSSLLSQTQTNKLSAGPGCQQNGSAARGHLATSGDTLIVETVGVGCCY